MFLDIVGEEQFVPGDVPCSGKQIMIKLKAVFGWFWLNFKFFIPVFLLVWVLINLFPDAMLSVFGRWASLLRAAGARNISEFATPSDIFAHILIRNGVTVLIYFAIGLFLQSPLVMVFTAAFYSFIAFLAPMTVGRAFGPNDWLLISVELFALILSISLSSALAGDLYNVEPNLESLLGYWKHNWSKLLSKPVNSWKLVLREWIITIMLTAAVIVALLGFVAWFETYGY